MASVERFEELTVWREARELVRRVYSISSNGGFAKDFEMRAQIRSAALSVMNNVAEGFERGGNREFIQFLNIAKGSAGEVRSMLYAALDLGYLSQEEFGEISGGFISLSKRLSSFIKYLQSTTRSRASKPENLKT